jgi:hypothetical protein
MITLIFIALIGLAISGGTFLAYQVMLNFHPGPERVRTELDKLLLSFKDVLPDLVPLDKNELELISHSQALSEVRGGIAKTAKGIIISIFEEPMMAFAYKRYTGQNENAALLVRTAHQEIFYRIRNQQVQVSLNNQPIGVIERNGVLYSPGNFQPLAQINKINRKDAYPITVEGKEVATLIPEDKTLKVHQRALQFVGQLNKREELFLIILLGWDLVRDKIDVAK